MCGEKFWTPTRELSVLDRDSPYTNEGVMVWSTESEDSDSQKLSLRLGVPLVIGEEPPDSPWILFFEDEKLFLFHTQEAFKPLTVDYLERDFVKRWKNLSRNDLFLRAIGLKKGVTTICDPTGGLGYDSFLLATVKGLEVTVCEKNLVLCELVMNALLRLKDKSRFEEFPLYFHCGDGINFLKKSGGASFDAVYLDPMYSRDPGQTAKQKKEMQLVRALVGEEMEEEALFAVAWSAAKKRVVVKRADDAAPIVRSKPADFSIEGKTVRYDVYLKRQL